MQKPYGATNILYLVWNNSRELAGYAQQDAHEFFITFINSIHSQLDGNHSI
jgi:ubiquitin carboxyl-terminal hydrolase 22/27/51